MLPIKSFGITLLSLSLMSGCAPSSEVKKFDVDNRATSEKILDVDVARNIPENLTASEQFLYAMKTDDTFRTMLIVVTDQMLEVLAQTNPELSRNEMQHYNEIGLEEADKMMPEIISDLAVIYERHFTEDELEEMSVFYGKGVGKKFLEKQQVLMAEGMVVGEGIGVELQRRMLTRIQQAKTEEE